MFIHEYFRLHLPWKLKFIFSDLKLSDDWDAVYAEIRIFLFEIKRIAQFFRRSSGKSELFTIRARIKNDFQEHFRLNRRIKNQRKKAAQSEELCKHHSIRYLFNAAINDRARKKYFQKLHSS